jgi:hypothetical protein
MMGANLFFGVKNLQKETSFLKKEYFVTNILFLKDTWKKNHKLIFEESLVTVITTTNYNFEETYRFSPP